MKFTVSFNLDNADFEVEGHPADRSSRAIRAALGDVSHGLRGADRVFAGCGGPIRDDNGNTIGHWAVEA